MIKPMLAAVAVAVSLVGSVWSAQIGDTVSAEIAQGVQIKLANSQIVKVLEISLDKGVWLTSGQITFVEQANGGFSLAVGAVSPELSLAGRGIALVGTEQTITNPARIPMAFASRTLEVSEDGTKVFLVAQSNQNPAPGPLNAAYVGRGFLQAVKINN